MSDIIKKISAPLDQADVGLVAKHIGKIKDGLYKGVFAPFKTSRSVVDRFNEVCGLGWEDEYIFDSEKNLTCILKVYDPEKNRWIKRTGIGTGANIETEKASYSDALKRASVQYGHGLELYRMPKIVIELRESEVELNKGKYYLNPYNLDLKRWDFSYNYDPVKKIIKSLLIKDDLGKVRCQIS